MPFVQLDAGHLFSSQVLPDGARPPEMLVRNGWAVQGYHRLEHDVVNLSYRDLFYADLLLRKEDYPKHLEQAPVLSRMISANVRALDDNLLNPPPYLIKELSGSRFPQRSDGRRTWRMGIVGVTELDPKACQPLHGFEVEDPLLWARKAILKARPQSDFLVVLAYVQEDVVFKLLDLNPEVDLVIAPRARWGRRYHGPHGMVAYADKQTKVLGELRVYLDETGKVKNIIERSTLLDDRLPDDSGMTQLVSAAREQIQATQKASLGPKYAPVSDTPLAAGLFVTAETCGACHHREFELWKESPHARAFQTLADRGRHFDPGCVTCHTTGEGQKGFKQIYLTPQLTGVQCESCHGPGQDHIADVSKPYGQGRTPEMCITCHTPAQSRDFSFAAHWPKVQH